MAKRIILTNPYRSKKIYEGETIREAIKKCYTDLKRSEYEVFTVMDIDSDIEYTFRVKRKIQKDNSKDNSKDINEIKRKLDIIEKNLSSKYDRQYSENSENDLDRIDSMLDEQFSINKIDTSHDSISFHKKKECKPKDNFYLETNKYNSSSFSKKQECKPKDNLYLEIKQIKGEIKDLKDKTMYLNNKINSIKDNNGNKEREHLEKFKQNLELERKNLENEKQRLEKERNEKLEKEKEKEWMDKLQRQMQIKEEEKEKEWIEKLQKQIQSKEKEKVIKNKCAEATDMDNWCIFM